MKIFPQDFLWGASTSAYQVEGGNINSDWWQWERASAHTPSGDACRHYFLFEKDFSLAAALGHNAHRFSLEWSRIQPQPNEFSKEALSHYQEVISSLLAKKIEPLVGLHHFTNPFWFSRLGGWENDSCLDHFLTYVQKVVDFFSPQVRYWVTINEPLVYAYHAYFIGAWPPQVKSFHRFLRVARNLKKAHIHAYRLIHNIYKTKGLPPPLVSIAKNLQAMVACNKFLPNLVIAGLRHYFYNINFLEDLLKEKSLDFIGINYYSRQLVDIASLNWRHLISGVCNKGHDNLAKNSLGWEIYPEGLFSLLLQLRRYRAPIIILENGICTDNDNLRWEFIRQHLEVVYEALENGVDVRGYLYWSLLDNFEWDKGFAPRFGLIEVDYNCYGRKIRESAYRYAQVIKKGLP